MKQSSDAGPTISCVVLAHRLSAETSPWFDEVREVVDELVVFVDIDRASEETCARARALTSAVYEVAGKGFVEAHLPEMVRACKGDWILRLDSDERLSEAWSDGSWRRFLDEDYTHFRTPRRWLHPAGGYLDSTPWWPDEQMRLFRNEWERIEFPQQIHEPTFVTGAGKYLPHLTIDHHVLRLSTRAEREEKVRHYTQLRPEKSLAHYYLFEEQSPSRAEIPRACPELASGADKRI